MKNYLLGSLDTERRTEFEQRILSEPDVFEELLLTEEELIDLYVAGSLSELERQQFESNFLITPKRHKDLQFGRLLKRYVNSHPAPVDDFSLPVIE